MLFLQHYCMTYLLARCYVNGGVHSAGCSGGTHGQNHINDATYCLLFVPAILLDVFKEAYSPPQ